MSITKNIYVLSDGDSKYHAVCGCPAELGWLRESVDKPPAIPKHFCFILQAAVRCQLLN